MEAEHLDELFSLPLSQYRFLMNIFLKKRLLMNIKKYRASCKESTMIRQSLMNGALSGDSRQIDRVRKERLLNHRWARMGWPRKMDCSCLFIPNTFY
jgi:hypothetical protein